MSTTTSHLLTLPDFLAADVSRPPSATARFRLGDAAAVAATPADTNRAAVMGDLYVNRNVGADCGARSTETEIVSERSNNRAGYAPIKRLALAKGVAAASGRIAVLISGCTESASRARRPRKRLEDASSSKDARSAKETSSAS